MRGKEGVSDGWEDASKDPPPKKFQMTSVNGDVPYVQPDKIDNTENVVSTEHHANVGNHYILRKKEKENNVRRNVFTKL